MVVDVDVGVDENLNMGRCYESRRVQLLSGRRDTGSASLRMEKTSGGHDLFCATSGNRLMRQGL